MTRVLNLPTTITNACVGSGSTYCLHCTKTSYNPSTGLNIFQVARWDEITRTGGFNFGIRVFMPSWERSPHLPLITARSEPLASTPGNHWLHCEGLPWYYNGGSYSVNYFLSATAYWRPLLPSAFAPSFANGGIGVQWQWNIHASVEGYSWPNTNLPGTSFGNPCTQTARSWSISERHTMTSGGMRYMSDGIYIWMRPDRMIGGTIDDALAALSNCMFFQFNDSAIPT